MGLSRPFSGGGASFLVSSDGGGGRSKRPTGSRQVIGSPAWPAPPALNAGCRATLRWPTPSASFTKVECCCRRPTVAVTGAPVPSQKVSARCGTSLARAQALASRWRPSRAHRLDLQKHPRYFRPQCSWSTRDMLNKKTVAGAQTARRSLRAVLERLGPRVICLLILSRNTKEIRTGRGFKNRRSGAARNWRAATFCTAVLAPLIHTFEMTKGRGSTTY
jgi:hypothetical protein